ncbi:MAG: molybdopterin-guanine dinucleotide biosynthesis protein B [Deltaproteobacteria bacterium]|nr:molybdopterin-guanine dinucleotide biosynthesis protein B [Deltaproteobacteria bacterium]
MIPIVSIVGRSKSGKTALIELLIPEFIRRGYRVATIKHNVDNFEIDHKGKDSWRHKEAGAQTVVISSPQRVALVEDASQDLTPDELAAKFIRGADIIIAEGFKRERHPKVEVFRKDIHPHPLASEMENLIAVVSDEPLQLDVPCLGSNDITGVADIIEERVISAQAEGDTTLWVDGEIISLRPFANAIISKTIQGMISSLKGCADPQEIEIRIQLRKRR